MVVHYQSAKISNPAPGITRRVLAHSSQLMLTRHVLKKGAALPAHQHPHEQLVYLLSGELLLEIGNEQLKMVEGDSLAIPSNSHHKATAVADSIALDIFSPGAARLFIKVGYNEIKATNAVALIS